MEPTEELQTLQLAFNLAPVGMCVSRDRVVEICNEAFARMFGYEIAELVGQPLAPLYPSLDEFAHDAKNPPGVALAIVVGTLGRGGAEQHLVFGGAGRWRAVDEGTLGHAGEYSGREQGTVNSEQQTVNRTTLVSLLRWRIPAPFHRSLFTVHGSLPLCLGVRLASNWPSAPR